MEEKKLDKVELYKIQLEPFKSLVSYGLITEQGIRIQGIGILIKQMGDLKELVDKTNLKLYGLGKEIEKLRMLIDEKMTKI